MYWKITPYHNNDADSCVLEAENEANHRTALEYAQARLEEAWDSRKPDGKSATVTIELCDGEMPEDEEP